MDGHDRARPIAFFALDRPKAGAVPVYEVRANNGSLSLTVGSAPATGEPLFHALPADAKDPPETTVPLYEFTEEDGDKRAYGAGKDAAIPGYKRAEQPACRVWRNPIQWSFPVDAP